MCPSCNSTDIRKLAVVYNEGISHGTVKVSGSFATGYAVHQTGLSRIAAPPQKRGYGRPILLTILLYILLRVLLDWLIGFRSLQKIPGNEIVMQLLFWGPIIAIVVMRFRYNHSTYPEKFRDWQNRFMCQRCGIIFPT